MPGKALTPIKQKSSAMCLRLKYEVTVRLGVILRRRSDRRILETIRFTQGDLRSGRTLIILTKLEF